MGKRPLCGLINPSYCLLDDYAGGEFDPESFWYDEDNNEYWLERNKIKYKDADVDSIRLYHYWKDYIENKKFPNGLCGKVEITNKGKQKILDVSVGDNHIELTADYIGPLKNAYRRRYDIKKLGILLKRTRTFSGSIIWPCRKIGRTATINQYKGCYLSERMDIVLMELKNYYLNKTCERKALMINFSNDPNKVWYECFHNFDGFIEYFCLQDFVNVYLPGSEEKGWHYKLYPEYLDSIEDVIHKREERLFDNL